VIPDHPPEPGAAPPPDGPDPAPAPDLGDPTAGAALVLLDFVGTGALLVACVAGILAPDGAGTFTVVVSGVLFAVGVVLFLYGYASGVVRSKDEQVTLGGLFFLSGTAPPVVRFRLRLAFFVQVGLAVAAAAIRPYTAVAFAVLAPMLGLGVMAAWAARHGTFFPRDDDRRRP
jgi:hypothetical protein